MTFVNRLHTSLPSTHAASAKRAIDATDHAEQLKAFRQSHYSMSDARATQQAFEIDTLEDAKRFIGLEVLTGREAILEERGITPIKNEPREELEAFTSSKYTDDNANQVRDQSDGKLTMDEGRQIIGQYILAFGQDSERVIREQLGIVPWAANDSADMAAFRASGYSVEDAKLCRDYLSNGNQQVTLEKAEEWIGSQLRSNVNDTLDDLGVTTSNIDPHELMAAFRDSKYDDNDAKAVRKWLGGDDEAPLDEAYQYIGLQIINRTEENLAKQVGIEVPGDGILGN